MRRRKFLGILGGAAAWPIGAGAQPERMRRVGVIMSIGADAEGQRRIAIVRQGLQQLGWAEGRNVNIEVRWTAGDSGAVRKSVTEIVALAPDVILAAGSAVAGPLLQATRTVPVVFVHAPDPVGAGFVESLARPGGNATGFTQFEYSMSGKWLELLKQIAPSVTRAAVLRDPNISAGLGQFGALQIAAPSFGLEVSAVNVRDPGEIERDIASFARSPNGGVIVTGSAAAVVHRQLIVTLVARHRLPAVYDNPLFVADGGLAAYGADTVDQYRRAVEYLDRILKGEKPGDLPVQSPTKYVLAINLKTAKALGLTVPSSLLTSATEVIE
jgi:putative ABC transport system substrate-binding protein